jgi:uncharacterized protein YndB with AHSA1/START domain
MAAFVAHAETVIAASPEVIWSVITDSEPHEEILAGARVLSDWSVGGEIRWQGEWEGKSFEDHGRVLELDAPRHLVVTHFSPMTGQEDLPENYHTLRYELTPVDGGTRVTLEQDNNPSAESAEHSAENWREMLEGVRAVAEGAGG